MSERVAYFDPNEEIRIGYIAGRTKGIEREKGLEDVIKKKDDCIQIAEGRIKELEAKIETNNENFERECGFFNQQLKARDEKINDLTRQVMNLETTNMFLEGRIKELRMGLMQIEMNYGNQEVRSIVNKLLEK